MHASRSNYNDAPRSIRSWMAGVLQTRWYCTDGVATDDLLRVWCGLSGAERRFTIQTAVSDTHCIALRDVAESYSLPGKLSPLVIVEADRVYHEASANVPLILIIYGGP